MAFKSQKIVAENKLVDDSNNGKPYILISNGQIKTDNGVDHIVEDINNPYHQAMTQKLPVAYTEGLWLEMKVRKVAQSFVVNIYVNTFLVGTATLPERLIKNTASTDSSVIVWDGNVYIAAVYQYFEDAGVAAFNPRIKYLADVEKITPVTRRELWRTG